MKEERYRIEKKKKYLIDMQSQKGLRQTSIIETAKYLVRWLLYTDMGCQKKSHSGIWLSLIALSHT